MPTETNRPTRTVQVRNSAEEWPVYGDWTVDGIDEKQGYEAMVIMVCNTPGILAALAEFIDVLHTDETPITFVKFADEVDQALILGMSNYRAGNEDDDAWMRGYLAGRDAYIWAAAEEDAEWDAS